MILAFSSNVKLLREEKEMVKIQSYFGEKFQCKTCGREQKNQFRPRKFFTFKFYAVDYINRKEFAK